MTYAQRYAKLLSQSAITPIPGRGPQNPPYPPWYNPKVTCVYHGDSPGHSIESCLTFKRIMQNMINFGWLSFDGVKKPDVNNNPLSDHGNIGTNVVEDSNDFRKNIVEVVIPLGLVLGALEKEGIIRREELDSTLRCNNHDETKMCEFHKKARGYSLDGYFQFQRSVQDLIDRKKIVFEVKSSNVEAINVIGDEFYKGIRPSGCVRPIVLPYFLEDQSVGGNSLSPKPVYTSDKTVPWLYEQSILEVVMDNILGVSAMTLSGRLFS